MIDTPATGTPDQDPIGRRASRGRWPLRDYPAAFWLLAALVVALMHRWVPSAEWLMVHLVLLGALSHAIVVWSFYFSQALLRAPEGPHTRRDQNRRIGLLLAGSATVLIGVPTGQWWLVVAGAALVVLAVAWHTWTLWRMLRRSLAGRFRVTLRYYFAAAASLAAGVLGGATLARGFAGPWDGRLLIAHTMANLLGWVGFTVLGTLVTFWPTILRTRMDDRADRLARQALPILASGLAVVVAGALVGQRLVALAGLACYLVGVLWWGRALLRPFRTKPPREFASASVAAALPWAGVALAWVGVLLVTADGWTGVSARFSPVAAVVTVGVGAQLLVGALSYLIPAVLGGGPAAARASIAWFNRFTTARLVLVNAGLLLFLLPFPSWVHVAVSVVGLAALGSFLVLMAGAVRAGVVRRRAIESGAVVTTEPAEPASPVWSGRQLVAAVGVLALAVGVGVGLDPAAAGLAGSPVATVQTRGQVVRLTVHANAMRFSPDRVTVDPGDALVIDLVNDDPSTSHDLSIAGRSTPRLGPGQHATLDVGVVSAPVQGWCTVAGHRAMGMVFDVLVRGHAAADPMPAATPGMDHPTGNPSAALGRHVDPALPPLPAGRVHRITLTVQEVPLEVAPGLWQKRWTYNGQPVGHTLHGRVGDVFEVTLVNHGTMGHSIDFHAGELAPDRPMRTIPPGQSLLYRFTAKRSGVWMYHCSTMPMSSHIAAGMHGAVVIEPVGLPPVARSYLLVQSEIYLQGAGADAAAAAEVDTAAVASGTPDRVVFNGIAGQYDQFPFTARVGERVRFWVLDAGPNRSTSVHIVGGQFDTVYAEGAYRLRQGRDAFGQVGGGSQALGLVPAQGGFVELVFPEAGRYPVVSHVMSDAERGAHGIVEVTP